MKKGTKEITDEQIEEIQVKIKEKILKDIHDDPCYYAILQDSITDEYFDGNKMVKNKRRAKEYPDKETAIAAIKEFKLSESMGIWTIYNPWRRKKTKKEVK